jgi:Ca2+-binding RTX toxin-like protein
MRVRTALVGLGVTALAVTGTTLGSAGAASANNGHHNGWCGDGYNVIVGSPEHDVLPGTFCNDVIFGLGGDDRINGRAGNDILRGGRGDDTIFSGEGRDLIRGGRGFDTCVGNVDTIFVRCEDVIVL